MYKVFALVLLFTLVGFIQAEEKSGQVWNGVQFRLPHKDMKVVQNTQPRFLADSIGPGPVSGHLG